MVVSSPKESRSRPARPLPHTAKGWSRCRDDMQPDVPLPVHSVPESSVAALASDPRSQCSVTKSSFGRFPKMALSKPCSLRGRWQRAGPSGSESLRAAKCLPLWIIQSTNSRRVTVVPQKRLPGTSTHGLGSGTWSICDDVEGVIPGPKSQECGGRKLT